VVIDYSFIFVKLLIWPTPVDIAVEQDRLQLWQVSGQEERALHCTALQCTA